MLEVEIYLFDLVTIISAAVVQRRYRYGSNPNMNNGIERAFHSVIIIASIINVSVKRITVN